ncbi:MAG: hypothetical protein A2261_02310 [Candidatus Magasanikbacteria bacterium RIFOXYA2_FULL_44_8]|uniref:Uncharacterized protein n=1 Tax=Candidatus Magasanikbacteria bacterium RIFOXYA2_FULL_44_8 TaxID=1798696 RepID=A0A1F6NJI9_9BACT|nr:MAG: hypothetical protein A2261_02310 [Candidatus Magasanikbacteria bacterium RIFOXYA2_FULL_44_8]
MQYFIGIICVLAGVALVIKTEWFIQNFGASAWAEAKFGFSGGTRLMYKVVGILLIFVGFLAVTNMYQGFLMATVGKLLIPGK